MKKNIISLSKEISEMALEKGLLEDNLKIMPIIGLLFSMYTFSNSVADQLLFNKIKIFIEELTLTDEEINELFERMDSEENFKQKISHYIIEIFSKLDDEYKVKMIAIVFKAYSNKKIDFEIFYRLNKVITNIYSVDINKVSKIKNVNIGENSLSIDILNTFSNINLTRIRSTMDGSIYEKTGLCEKFIELELDKCYMNVN